MIHLLARLIQADEPARLEHNLRWLYSFVRPQQGAIIRLMLLSMLATGLVLMQPWLTKLLIDDGLLARNWQQLCWLAAAMVVAGMAATALAGFNRYQYTRLSGQILFDLRSHLFRHLQNLSPRFFGQQRLGDLLSRLDGDVSQIQRFAVDSLFSALTSVLGLIGALTLMLLLSWQLSLLVLVLVPLEFVWLRKMRRKVEQETRTTREAGSDIASFLVETLPATRFVQAAGREQHEQQRLEQVSQSYLHKLLTLQVTEFFTQAVPSTLTALTRAAAFLIGGWWVMEGQWQLGSLIAFSTYLGMATGPVNSLLGLYVAVQRMSVSLNRVGELRDHQPEVQSPAQPQTLAAGVPELRLHNLGFGYHQSLLQNVNLTIAAGQKMALSGPSGVGKSTLIDLLQRYYDPQAGQIQLAGIDIRQLALTELRQRVVVVSQEIVLFRGSLRDNLLYVAPDASEKQLQQAIRDACLQELVEHLPDGIHSLLGERGQRLSGGQKQRLAIARALLQNPAILILDEATSAVDEQTEREVIDTIDRLFPDRTRILISHRPTTLAGCDRHLHLHDGQLQECAVIPRQDKGALYA